VYSPVLTSLGRQAIGLERVCSFFRRSFDARRPIVDGRLTGRRPRSVDGQHLVARDERDLAEGKQLEREEGEDEGVLGRGRTEIALVASDLSARSPGRRAG
jgi:hypothetical protein